MLGGMSTTEGNSRHVKVLSPLSGGLAHTAASLLFRYIWPVAYRVVGARRRLIWTAVIVEVVAFVVMGLTRLAAFPDFSSAADVVRPVYVAIAVQNGFRLIATVDNGGVARIYR